MAGRIRLVCVLHSHQPVGNFDHVIEDVSQKSYLRFTEVFDKFPDIPISLHYSGCLLEWLEEHHPEYIAFLRGKLDPGRGKRAWELIGGGMEEPIFTMLPARDRLGQIRMMADYLEDRFGRRPRGVWAPERVWEPALVSDFAQAGVQYLTLDDNHFKAAGLTDEELTGGFTTEDQGCLLRAYPALERLRYLIPFHPVDEAMDFLRSILPAEGERVVCYADDGEKFGSWPYTFKHVYTDGWLEEFLEALRAAQEEGWLVCSTLGDAYDGVPPVGRLYIPENSYREMTEWALPARTLAAYEHAREMVREDAWVPDILPLVRGGSWRAFRVKYPEAGHMYAKMMEVSAKVAALPADAKLTEKARYHLYRGQCNCAYWHGVFGGLYLPHLRNAIFTELIRAEKLADEVSGDPAAALMQDLDLDGQDEVKLANPHLALYLHPGRGGHLYEFDLREVNFNVADTFSRRYEAYHEKVPQATVTDPDAVTTIHGLVRAKEEGLDKLLRYDAYLRESLVDHLGAAALTPADFLSGDPPSDPGFRQGRYQASWAEARPPAGTAPGGTVVLTRAGRWAGGRLELRKTVKLTDGSDFEVEYELRPEGTAAQQGFLAVEMNYNLLAGNAEDRYYCHEGAERAGPLNLTADFGLRSWIGLMDRWLGIRLRLRPSVKAQVLVSPVRTVSNSEGGFESVYQSSSVVLQWPVRLRAGQPFRVRLVQEVGRVRA